jgi:hypothetical protein
LIEFSHGDKQIGDLMAHTIVTLQSDGHGEWRQEAMLTLYSDIWEQYKQMRMAFMNK